MKRMNIEILGGRANAHLQSFRSHVWARSLLLLVLSCALSLPTAGAYAATNGNPVTILSQLDIDADGLPDAAPDTDNDGLPDNWEVGPPGVEPMSFNGDRLVRFPAPTAIGPGTPPTFIFARQAVTTSAIVSDTDGDGLSDFSEVFGLKYIDDNGNGRLDFIYTDTNGNGAFDAGEPVDVQSEWMDLNLDGLPSIGEYPLPNYAVRIDTNADSIAEFSFALLDSDSDGRLDAVNCPGGSVGTLIDNDGNGLPENFDCNGDGAPDGNPAQLSFLVHDFDGFVFTDPTQADTDHDGLNDGVDPDPLINPATFGISSATGACRSDYVAPAGCFTRSGVSPSDWDLDNDGLGNGSDFGNDLIRAVDYPTDIRDLLELFRPDRLKLATPTIPESLIEDLIGADWNGDGLYRITDHRDFYLDMTQVRAKLGESVYQGLCYVGAHPLFAANTGIGIMPTSLAYGSRSIGLGCQMLLLPAYKGTVGGAGTDYDRTEFLPDPRVWTVLYAWRMPGFDIDGDGFVGSSDANFAQDDLHNFVGTSSRFDGRIDPVACGASGAAASAMLVGGLIAMRLGSLRGRRGRPQ